MKRAYIHIDRAGKCRVSARWTLPWRGLVTKMFILGLLIGLLLGGIAAHAALTSPEIMALLNESPPAAMVPDYTKQATVQWVQSHAKYRITPEFADLVVTEARTQSEAHNINPTLVVALMKVESEFDAKAESSAGAVGLTQVLPRWHTKRIGKTKVGDPRNNIRIGVEILREYIDNHKGDMRRALLQYNGALHIKGAPFAKKVLSVQASLEKDVLRGSQKLAAAHNEQLLASN